MVAELERGRVDGAACFSMRRLLALVMVAVGVPTLTTASGAFASDEPTPKVKHVAVEAADLSVAYPVDWERLELTDQDIESVDEVLRDDNPELSDSLDQIDSSAIKLHAQDVIDGDSVSVHAAPGVLIGGKKFVRSVIEAQLEGTSGFEVVRMRDVKIGGKRGVRADYRYELDLDGESVPIYEIGVFLPIGGGEVATVDVAVDDEPADIVLADEIARSVRRL